MGFIEPGHGGKARKVWLLDNKDVKKMYEVHQQKKQILLWCYTHAATQKKLPVSQKKSDGAPKPNTGSNYATQLKKQEEVNGIFSQLKIKYEGKFKSEQLHTWAHMIYLKIHDSLDNPPDKPFFTGQRKRASPESTQSLVSKKPTSGGVISPGKRVNIRSELIDQLKKCQDFINSGAITKEVFDELRLTILADLKKL